MNNIVDITWTPETKSVEGLLPSIDQVNFKAKHGGAFSKWTYTFPSLGAPIRQLRDATGYNAARYGQGYADTWLNFSISIVNSFNGLTPVYVTSEHQDVSCLNSLTMSFKDTTRLRHSTNIDVTKLADWMESEALNFKTKIAVWQSWAEKKITPEQAEETLKLCGVSDRLTKQLMLQFEEEASKRSSTVWALASSLSFMSTHNSERFGVRGSAKKDNEARSLHARQNQVLKIMDQPAWAEMAAA